MWTLRDPSIQPRVPVVAWELSKAITVGGYRTTTHDSGPPKSGMPVVELFLVEAGS